MDKPAPQGRNDGHVFGYSKITDNIFIGSDLCQGGICVIHGEEFKRLGVGVELNLSAENNEFPPKELEVYLWLPVVDGYAPSSMQLDMGTCTMHDAIGEGKKVYVHCRNGHGRSPTMVAAYLIRYEGHTVDSAVTLVQQLRPEAHIEDVQKKALEDFSIKWQRKT